MTFAPYQKPVNLQPTSMILVGQGTPKERASKTLLDYHEGQLSLVGECGDHVAAKSLTGS